MYAPLALYLPSYPPPTHCTRPLSSSPPFPTPALPQAAQPRSFFLPSRPLDIHHRLPVQACSPNQELSERGRIEREVEVIDRGVLQVEAAGGCGAVDDGLVLGLLPAAAHCGVACIA